MILLRSINIALLAFLTSFLFVESKSNRFSITKVEKIGPDTCFKYDMSIEKLSDHESRITGTVDQLIELDDENEIEFRTYHKSDQSNDYDETDFHYLRKGVCEFLKGPYKYFIYTNLHDHSNFPHFDKCPISKKKYWIKNHVFNLNYFGSIAKPGYWKLVLTILKDYKLKCGVVVLGKIEEIDGKSDDYEGDSV